MLLVFQSYLFAAANATVSPLRAQERYLVEITKEDKNFVGKPKISELIEILQFIKDKFGDVPVVGAYDGDWNCDVEIMIFDDNIIIGTIS